ncbi:MAG: hypothetical protein EBS84_21135 [Proteobacteria bacterium]|nr:hypothetical protein [Pseudomonadota bacterium]
MKPENVMVGEFGEVLVMDWGLAKHLDDEQHAQTEANQAAGIEGFTELSDAQLAAGESGLTMEGAVMGSPQYMPPEQAEGRLADIGTHSDIYSLGGILYAILTLRHPVEGRQVSEVLSKVISGEITPPTHYNASRSAGPKLAGGTVADASKVVGLPHCPGGKVPASLSAVTMRAMALRPEDRYAEVPQIVSDVEAYQGGFATSAEKANALTLVRLFIHRHKALTVAASLIVLLTMGFLGKVVSSEQKAKNEASKAREAEAVAEQKEKQAQASFAQAQIALAEAAFRSGDYSGMVQALDACPPDKRDSTWSYLSTKRDASLGRLRVPGFESFIGFAAVPGQPGQFALVAARGEIGFVDAAGGSLLRTVKTSRTGLREVTFSGDGQTFAVRAGGREVDLYDTATGSLRKTLTLPTETVQQIVLGHDASLLAAISGSLVGGRPNGQLTLIETATGQTRWLQRASYYGSVTIHPDGSRVIASSGGSARFCWIFNAADGREVSQFPVYAMCQALHPDGKTIAIGTQQGEVMLASTSTGAVLQQGKLHSGRMQAMAWTADGHLLTMGEEGKINSGLWLFRLWDPEFLALRATFAGLNPGPNVAWALNTASGHLLTRENPPRLWRIPVGRELVKLSQLSEQGWGGAFLSDTVLIARKHYELARYDLSMPGRMVELPGGLFPRANYCVTDPASGSVAVGPKIGTAPFLVKLFATEGSAVVEKRSLTLPNHVADLAFDYAANRLAVTHRDGSLEAFSVRTGESQLKIPGRFERAAFAGSAGHLVALAPHTIKADAVEFHLHQLDGVTGKMLASATNRFHVQAFAVSPDRKLVALGGSDRSVHLFDAATLRETNSFRAHDGDVGALAFHPGLPIIASASADGSVKIWDHSTGKLLDYFLGLAGNPVVLSFSPNGKLLMVDGQERTTRIYDLSHITSLIPRSAPPSAIPTAVVPVLPAKPAAGPFALAHQHARAGRWSEARPLFVQLAREHPNDSMPAMHLGTVLAQLGDHAAFREHGRAILKQFEKSQLPGDLERAAKLNLMLPIDDLSADNRESALRMARAAAAAGPSNPYFQSVQALGQYRVGDFAGVLETLRSGNDRAIVMVAVGNSALIAMAHHRLGSASEARAALTKAETLAVDQLPRPDAPDLGPAWNDVILALNLLSEARDLLKQ